MQKNELMELVKSIIKDELTIELDYNESTGYYGEVHKELVIKLVLNGEVISSTSQYL